MCVCVCVCVCSVRTALYPGGKDFVVIYILDTHTLRDYSSFRHLTHAIHLAFPLSVVYLTTQVCPFFEIHELTWPVKDQYVTLSIFAMLPTLDN